MRPERARDACRVTPPAYAGRAGGGGWWAQALVEFALAIAAFMLLVLGTFDLARANMAYTVTANAARESARFGAAHLDETNWDAAAEQAGRNLAVGLDDAALDLTVDTIDADNLTFVRVRGTYAFRALTPGVSALLGSPINLRVDTSALAS
jgi:Flp pilus assembly protein TadG